MSEKWNIQINSLVISSRLSNILMPINTNFFVNRLVRSGFKQLPVQNIGLEFVPVDAPLVADKFIQAGLDDSRKLIKANGLSGDDGLNISGIVRSYEKILDDLQESSDNRLKFFFHEIIINSLIESNNPLETFSHPHNQLKNEKEINGIFNELISPYGIRLSPSNKSPDSTDWFEYRIEPYVTYPEKFYNINYIYRNKDLSKVTESLMNFNNITEKLIKMIKDNKIR